MSKKLTLVLFVFLLATASAFGQGLIMPFVPQSFTNANGGPLSGGRLFFCQAGTSCPGTTQAAFNSSALTTPWSNPLILDGSGFVPGGLGVWLTPGVGYKLVWSSAQGAVVGSLDNVYGSITQSSAALTPGGSAGSVQYNNGSSGLGGDGNLVWQSGPQVLSISGTLGQAAVKILSGYEVSYGGYVSQVAPSGSWQGFNSLTDGASLRGYSVQQNASNNAGGYIDLNPISYNPYNGSQCIDIYGNVVQQPLPLNGLASFGSNDSILWVGTSPSMPSNGSCGVPLPVSPSQTYGGVANQSFGLFLNSYFFARGGVATDNNAFNSFQALQGGMYAKLGFTTDQATYPKAYAASTSLNNPGAGYGGFAYQGGSIYYYYNATSGTWGTVNLATGGGGGGSAQGPANAIQTNDPAGAGAFTGYSWLTVNVGGGFGGYIISKGGLQVPVSGSGGCTNYNCVDVLAGGIHTGLGITADQAFYPKGYASTGSLNVPASGYGGFSYSGAGSVYYYYNATTPAWASVDFSTSGSGCTISGATTGNVIFAGSSTTCNNSTTLSWANSTAQLTIGGGTSATQSLIISNGYGIANGGWNSGSCALATCVQSPNGGLSAGLGVTTNQAFYPFGYASATSLNPPASGYGGFGYTGSGLNYWVWNATSSTWNNINLGSGGGGGACPAGSANYVQYNNGSGGCGASANLTFNSGANVLNIGGTLQILGVNSIDTTNRFVGAGGVNVTGPVVSAGVIQSTVASGTAFQVGSGIIQLLANGTANANLVNALNGLQINGTTVVDASRNLTNIGNEAASGVIQTTLGSGVAFQAGGGTFQAFANGNVNAANYNAASTSITLCSQTGITFSNSNCNFVVNSAGALTANGVIATNGGVNVNNPAFNSIQTTGNIDACTTNACSGGNAIAVRGTTVINSAFQFIGSGGISTSGGGTFGLGVTMTSGLVTGSSSNSTLYIGTGGNFYTRFISSSTGVSCSGVANGWMAVSMDGFIVFCGSGVRSRAALAIY